MSGATMANLRGLDTALVKAAPSNWENFGDLVARFIPIIALE
jgi:hypothetical protein